MPITPIDCSNMIIYKIQHNDKPELLYIGSTTNFKMRKNKHKLSSINENYACYKCLVYKMIRNNGGWDNFTMIQFKEFPCNSKREAEAEEYKLMHELKASMNVHTFSNDNRNERIKIHNKKYYEANKEHIKEQSKEYREANKENKKEYYEANKESIATKQKEKFECICGSNCRKSYKSRHFRSNKHLKYIAENPDVLPSN